MIERRCFDTIYLFFFSFLLSYYYILSFTNEGSLLIYILFFSVLFWEEFLKKKVGYCVCVHIPLCTLMFLSSALSPSLYIVRVDQMEDQEKKLGLSIIFPNIY